MTGWSSRPDRHRRRGDGVRLRARRPAARAGLQPGRHPRRGPAPGRGRGASRLLRGDAAGPGRDPGLPVPRPPRRPALGTPWTWRARCTGSWTPSGPTMSSSTTWRSAHAWRCSRRGVPHADVVLGHPSALVVGDEVYGYPPAWPPAVRPGAARPDGAAPALRGGPGPVHRRLERRAHHARPGRRAERGRLRGAGRPAAPELPLRPAPARAHPSARHARVPRLRRPARATGRGGGGLARAADTPVVYVSLGSFLSVRSDVLAAGGRGPARAGRAGGPGQRRDPRRPARPGPRPPGWCEVSCPR